jgi:uncharacterized protein (DUF3084 family)
VPEEKPALHRSRAREVKEDESQYKRDTLPPTPDKARIIETAINREVITRLDAVAEDADLDDAERDTPSVPPPDSVPMEQIKEGVQYRIVQPATKLPATRRSRQPDAGDGPEEDLAMRERALGDLEAEIREREERLLQREVVVGGREKILRKKEERLHQREVSLRNWEARLMDKEASLREASGPEARHEPRMEPEEEELRPRTSELRIEIPGGSGAWEMVEEPEDGSEDGS